MIDIIIIFSSMCLGVICSIFLYNMFTVRRERKSRIIGNVKHELNNLFFEKSLALEALNKINQIYEEKKIDVFEKDRLKIKYIEKLNDYNKRIFQIQPRLEIQEIYQYRDQLNSLLTDYIKTIDQKLSNYSSKEILRVESEQENGFKHNHKVSENIDSTKETNRLELHGSNELPTISDFDGIPLEKLKSGVNLKNSSSISTSSHDTNENILDKNPKNDIKYEDIEKIQQDILKTLRRLEET